MRSWRTNLCLAAILATVGLAATGHAAQSPLEAQRAALRSQIADIDKRIAEAHGDVPVALRQRREVLQEELDNLPSTPPLPAQADWLMPPPSEVDRARELFRTGPAVPQPRPDTAGFSVDGFLRDGWPVVMDIKPEPNTRTTLLIMVYVRGPWGIPLPFPVNYATVDRDGLGGRHIVHLDTVALPAADGDPVPRRVRVAAFVLNSWRLREDGKAARDDRGRKIPAPVTVYGFGAGPRAVGSVSIGDVAFSPQVVVRPASATSFAPASYRFVARKPFDQVDSDVWLNCRPGDCRNAHPRPTDTKHLLGVGSVSGVWQIQSSARPGAYQVYVRAWLQCLHGDPTNQYAHCEDDAAWATGFSDPIAVR